MSRNKRPKREARPVHLIVVDGETEKWYFDLLKEKESLRNFKVDPELCKKRTLKEQCAIIEESASVYKSVIWVIDLDVILKESQEAKKGERKRIDELREYMKLLEKQENVHVLINVPCLEFWYLLHLKKTNRYYADYNTLQKELKNTLLDGYEKSEKYYKKRGNDIYSKPKPYLNEALINAKSLGNFDVENPQTGKAEMYKVFELIGFNCL